VKVQLASKPYVNSTLKPGIEAPPKTTQRPESVRGGEGLADRATLEIVSEADHSFHVLVRSGRTNDAVLEEVLETMVRWRLLK
jgi:hypothetical protein